MTCNINHGDCREVLKICADAGIMFDACVTDPPYHLTSIVKRFGSKTAAPAKFGSDGAFARASKGFMGQEWDGGDVAFQLETWEAVYNVMKPGAYLLAFGGTRTYHRLACAIEDGGFDIRDTILWHYGCLDTETQIVTNQGIKFYTDLIGDELVLCYSAGTKEYLYQPILEIMDYDYSDIAYRITGDFGEQVVSRNHRCLVEREGREVFVYAEALQPKENIPFLESVSELQHTLSDTYKRASNQKQGVWTDLRCKTNKTCSPKAQTFGRENRTLRKLLSMWKTCLEVFVSIQKSQNSNVQQKMQWCGKRKITSALFWQRPSVLDRGKQDIFENKNDGGNKSVLERGLDLSESQGQICHSKYKVCSMPSRICKYVSQRWVRHGAQDSSGAGNRTEFNSHRSSASHKPRCDRQSAGKPDVVCDQCGPQKIRAWSGHKTSLASVTPIQYTGKVWCIRVPTGCFVAYRKGLYFPTGNSGFPKSHNQGDGRGTALKPATEIIAVARKPFAGTVATNLEKWGTGALNIDACRVELASDDILQNGVQHTGKKLNTGMADTDWGFKAVDREKGLGRWPANLIHDGSDEVLALFPKSKGQLVKSTDAQRSKANVYGIPSDNGKEYQPRNDSGSAARFFYCAKANKKDRAESTHPTVKPIALIRYLCRLITPPNGLILDPFAGSGTTGQAAHEEGFNSYLIEQSDEYIKHIQKRMEMLN